jgi:hypothetical protein
MFVCFGIRAVFGAFVKGVRIELGTQPSWNIAFGEPPLHGRPSMYG